MGGECSMYGKTRNVYRGLVEKHTEILICRPRHRWKNKIKRDPNKLGLDSVDGFIWLGIGASDGLLYTKQ